MQKILIVEDDRSFQERYAQELGSFDLLQAFSLEQGRKSFEKFATEIKAIVLDGSLGNGEFGHTLAGEIREAGYVGPMIASSSLSSLNASLRKSGCNHCARKEDVGAYLRILLPEE